jgi:hypothetical protein
MVEDYRNALVWQHGGNTPGMTTAVGMLPEKKFGVVVLSNMQSAALPDLLRQYIFDRELGAPMRDLSAEALTRTLAQRKRADSLEKVQQAGHPADLPSPIPAQAFVGTYADSLYGDAVVSIKDGKLFLVRGDWSGALQYWNATNFRWLIPPGSPTGPMTIKFDVSADNTVAGLWFGIGGDVTLLSKKGGRGGGRAGGRGGV